MGMLSSLNFDLYDPNQNIRHMYVLLKLRRVYSTDCVWQIQRILHRFSLNLEIHSNNSLHCEV